MKNPKIVIPKNQLELITCPRCKGDGDDPESQPYFREFNCKMCKGARQIIMIKPEYYLEK